MKTAKNRIEWIDTAKGIGLLCVILGHLHIPYLSAWIYTFHIPLFFFLSGCVFNGQKYSFKEYFIRRFKSLIVPYFVLGAVILFFNYVVFLFQKQPIDLYVKTAYNFLRQEHFWTIWFLACLFFTEIIYYGIHRLCQNRLPLIFCVSLLLCAFGMLRYRLGWGSLPWNIDVALIAQFFFNLGYIFKTTKFKDYIFSFNRIKYLLFLGAFFVINAICGALCIKLSGESLDMSVGLYGNELLTVISAVAGILAIVMFSNKFKFKPIKWLGQNTMIIFAWHSRIIIVLCDLIFNKLGFFTTNSTSNMFVRGFLIFIIIFVVLVPVTKLVKNTKIHKLFGV